MLVFSFSLQLFTECHLIQKLLDGYAINDETYVGLVVGINLLITVYCLMQL